jgi:polysaccharide pyruvyl transferase CsaB
MSTRLGGALSPRRTRFVCIGYFGKQNWGDDALLEAFIREVEQLGVDRRSIVVASHDAADTRSRHGVNAFDARSPLGTIDAVFRADHVVLAGGGWHFGKIRASLYSLLVLGLARALGRPITVYCIGVEPIAGSIPSLLVRTIMPFCSWVSVRDLESAEELSRIGVRARVSVAADPVFGWFQEAAPSNRCGHVYPDRPRIAISLLDARGARKYDAIRRDYSRIVDGVIESLDADVILIATSPGEGDYVLAEAVQSECRLRERVRVQDASARGLHDVLRIVSQSDMVIGMRYHALVVAALAGVPFGAIVRSPKVSSLCRELGQPVLGRVDSYSVEEAVRRIRHAFDAKDELREVLVQRTPVLATRYREWVAAWGPSALD